jgi:hypothetical protein
MRYPNAPFLEKVTQEVPLRSPTYEFPEVTIWSAQKFFPQADTHELPEVNTSSANIKPNGVSYRECTMRYVVSKDKDTCDSVLYESLS